MNQTTLELTEVETKLRQLLLDVAAYIDESVGTGPIESAVKVPDELAHEKVVLRFTGGWVRDKLLGVGSQDIDVAINKMTGEHFGLKMLEYLDIPGNAAKYGLEERAESPKPNESDSKPKAENGKPKKENGKSEARQKSRKVGIGLTKIQANPDKSKNLETATTKIMGIDLDLVNLRKETYNEVSRNPEIEFGTPEEDAMRRDATVNAMFYNLNTSTIEDFTGRGFQDMEAKLIRTPLEPYQTFKDDPLRILRLIRFASRLGYTIDPETERAMSNAEIGEVLRIKISRERVGIELEKMLKGPDPLRAMSLIDRLGLYHTIFTDPTRELGSAPDLAHFSPAYNFVHTITSQEASDVPSIIPQTLARDADERYLAWICAALMPWADAPTVPHHKPTQRPHYAAYLVARDGFKAPNRVCDVISASLRHGEEIRQMVDRCYDKIKRPNATKVADAATARDTLGMAIRRWGASWRTQVLFNLIYEVVLGFVSRDRLLDSYATFLNQVIKYNILEAHTFRPLLTGTELAQALNTKPGPWMKDALDVVMAWQLRNSDVTDPTEAIAAVKASKEGGESKTSELSSSLATHFLTLTVRPLFSQTKSPPDITPAGHKAPTLDHTFRQRHHWEPEPWKDTHNAYVIDLFRWTLSILDPKSIEQNWALLIPPILKMMDDISLPWKARGVALLTQLLKSTPPPLLARTGLGALFEDSLFPLFTYLPTLTPEDESCQLLDNALPALLALGDVLYPSPDSPSPSKPFTFTPPNTKTPEEPPSALSTPLERFLDRTLRLAILAPLSHAHPSTYPRLATTLLLHLPALIDKMGINAVKHLQPLTTLLSNILFEPFGLAYPPLMVAAAQGLQRVVANTWPRVSVYRGVIVKGCVGAWGRCVEEEGDGKEGVEEVKREIKELMAMVEAVLEADEETRKVWRGEKEELIKIDETLKGLFEKSRRGGSEQGH
ncbi:poly A polymerase C-terminal region-like protein [Westerdykella ornata]|uniref:Poly A polymerase C-terminal region-like protein n=1 Tax=Westerdykella ornata TaxID=318751 RepID=A0A6A6JA21_WESOR|nr:poly A polymerase C-terminal region-like protein [Westerdykella ornata]KAF2273023.1 poly A polymerase C-terminal region-like protein [Westerdykella ornata]